MSLLPSPQLSMAMTSEQLNTTLDLSILKRQKIRDSAADIANRMILLITLLGVHLRGASAVFGSLELMMEILSYSNFRTIMAVSRSNKHGRRIAQCLVRDRFRNVLDPFVAPARFSSFLDMLADTGAAVNGSTVRRLLAQQSDFLLASSAWTARFNHTTNLNIVSPRGRLEDCKTWFAKDGYTWKKGTVSMAYRSVVREFWIGRKPVEGDGIDDLVVMIALTASTINNVLLASPFTSQANMITSTSLYSLWPNLITSKECIRTDLPMLRNARRTAHCYTVQSDNAYWKKACGKYCPVKERPSTNDSVTAMFTWNALAETAADVEEPDRSLWMGPPFVYRFARQCRNVRCKNYSSNRYLPPMH